MYLHEKAYDSFILMQSDWQIDKTKQLLERLKASHVIIQHSDIQSEYYLYKSDDILKQLSSTVPDQTLHNALKLDELSVTPVCDAYSDAEEAPDFCVVTDEKWVTGFYDVSVPPSHRQKRGDAGEVATDEFMTRSLVAEFPDQVALNDTVSLVVSLSAEEVTNHDLPIALPKGSTVDIIIQTRRYLTMVSKSEGKLVISDEDETLPLQFKLKANTLGQGKIRVLAFHDGQALGQIKLSPLVVEQATENIRTEHEQNLENVNAEQPDLLLLILEHEHRGEPAVTFRLYAKDHSLGLDFKAYGPISLRLEPLQFFQDFFKDIENMELNAATERRLANKGAHLFETVFPKELQVLLWKLKDRIQSVKIQSDEPWIPWELCRLHGRDENGRLVESAFFCEAFTMTRWIPGMRRTPHLSFNKMALVVPTNSGLTNAKEEQDYLKSLANQERQINLIKPQFLDVYDALASGEYDVWHFTGHGVFRAQDPNRSGIMLEDGKFTAEDLSGEIKNLGNIHNPLIFLNACQAGRGALSLTDIGGFAAQSLRAGAGAFIGAYWSISDNLAYQFAEAFYDRLLAGKSIGKAVQEARLVIKESGDPTWLAYTVYADPLAVVSREHDTY